jgi:molybdate transport system ATP-binding protein
MTLFLDLNHSVGDFNLALKFQVPNGVSALFGRSGAGKTTLVNAVAGLITPQKGRIEIAGRAVFDAGRGLNIPPHQRGIGYVFQDPRLFPHMSVQRNLNYGRRPARSFEIDANLIIDILGLEKLLDRRPDTLSGGEKQRVAIARALLSNPDLLLLDEPLAALDRARKLEILSYLERLRDELRLPMLYVSHSVPELARLATDIVVMDAGKLVACGPASDLLSDPSLVPQLGLAAAGASVLARLTAAVRGWVEHLEHLSRPAFFAPNRSAIGQPRAGTDLGTRRDDFGAKARTNFGVEYLALSYHILAPWGWARNDC